MGPAGTTGLSDPGDRREMLHVDLSQLEGVEDGRPAFGAGGAATPPQARAGRR
jgi:hypothetical protein